MRGIVRMLKREKGFGFIVEGTGPHTTKPAGDYFFHRSGCTTHDGYDRLREGDAVTFEVVSPEELDKRDRNKGPRAKNVEKLDEA